MLDSLESYTIVGIISSLCLEGCLLRRRLFFSIIYILPLFPAYTENPIDLGVRRNS